MTLPAGIFPQPAALPTFQLLRDNPVTTGYRQEDEFQGRGAEREQRLRISEADLVGRQTDREHRMRVSDEDMDMRRQDLAGRELDREARMRASEVEIREREQRMKAGEFSLGEQQRQAREREGIDAAIRRSYAGGRPAVSDETIEPRRSARAAEFDGSFDPDRYTDRIVKAESGGNDRARPIDPRTGQQQSTALGRGQFIEETWLSVVPEVAKMLGQDIRGASREDLLALRESPQWSRAGIIVLAEQNRRQMEPRLKRPVSEGDLHLGHFLGAGGASQMLEADPSAIAATVLPKAAASNPAVFTPQGRPPVTVADIVRRYGAGGAPPAAAPAGVQPYDAPGSDPTSNAAISGQMATPQGQAAAAAGAPPIAPIPTAPAPAAPTSPPVGAGMGLDPSQDPQEQRMAAALAATPGGGAKLLELQQKGISARGQIGLKLLEMAGRGEGEAAAALAQSMGMQITPQLQQAFTDTRVAKQMLDIAKSITGQDPVWGQKFGQSYAETGGNTGAAMAAAGTPTPRVYGAGRTGALIRLVPGVGLVHVDPVTRQPEIIVPVGDLTSPYKMEARARELATREAGGQIVHPGAAWVDQRTQEIVTSFHNAQRTHGGAPLAPAPAGGAPQEMSPGGFQPDLGTGSEGMPMPAPMGQDITTMAPPQLPSLPGAPAAAPGGAPPQAEVLRQAQEAIARGAPIEQVRQRAMQHGVDISPILGQDQPGLVTP